MLKRQMKGWKFPTPTDLVCPLPLRVLGGSKNWLEIFTIILFFSKIVSVTHSLSLKLTQHNVFLSSLSVQRYQNPIYRQYLTENILHSEHDKLLQRTIVAGTILTNVCGSKRPGWQTLALVDKCQSEWEGLTAWLSLSSYTSAKE